MSRWYTFHIKNEILFWFFLLALLPLFILTTINYIYQKNQYEDQSKKHLSLILNQKLHLVHDHIDLVQKEIMILSTTPNVKDAMKEYNKDFTSKLPLSFKKKVMYEKYFQQIVVENEFHDIFLIDKQGNIVYTVAKEADLHTNLLNGPYSKSNLAKLFKSTSDLLDTQVSDFAFYTPSNKDAAFVATPVFGKGELLGVIAVQLTIKKLDEMFLDQEGLGTTGEFFAAKLDGSRIISTTPLKNNKESVKYKYQFKNDPNLPIYKAVYGEKGAGIAKDYAGDEIVAAWGYIPYLRWGVVAKMDLQEVVEPIERLKFYSIIILFFVALGIVIAILAAIKHIVEPIEKLNQNVKNFSQAKVITSDTIDVENEIGELSRNFNEMATTLRSSQDTIQNYANELEQKVRERTLDLEIANNDIELANKKMEQYLSIVNKYVITSTTDLSGTITSVSKAFCEITGYSEKELIGKKHNIIRHPDMSSDVYKDLWDTITLGKSWQGEIKNLRKDGGYYWVDSKISPVYDDGGNITGYTSVRQDITDKKIIEELSVTDQLTKLYNRLKLEEVFDIEINRAQRYGDTFGVILLDIDHFKSVNDTYGHDIGDKTLVDVANILKQSVRKTDIVGRWGGEEFVIITINTNLEQSLELAQKIRKNIETHYFEVVEHKTSSFGVSVYHPNDTQEVLVKRADEALYKAKENGRNRVETLETV